MTAPILTDVVGVPATITRRDQLTGTMSFDPPFLGGVVGGGVGVVPIRWSVGNSRWENVNTSGQLQTPAARDDVPGVVKPEGVVIFDLHWVDEQNVRQSTRLDFRPEANASGVLDLTVMQDPKEYRPTADIDAALGRLAGADELITRASDAAIVMEESADDLAQLSTQLAAITADALQSQRSLIQGWAAGQAYQTVTPTRSATGLLQTATVIWPDGSTGVYTGTTYDATYDVYLGYTVTHAASGTTVTQPAVTLDAGGAITNAPAPVLTPSGTATAGTYDTTGATASALNAFRAIVNTAQRTGTPVSIGVIGGLASAGGSSVGYATWVDGLRERLQSILGDGGRGYVGLGSTEVANQGSGALTHQLSLAASGMTLLTTKPATGVQLYSPTGQVVDGTSTGWQMRLKENVREFDTVELFYLNQPSGGTFDFGKLKADNTLGTGTKVTGVSTAAASTALTGVTVAGWRDNTVAADRRVGLLNTTGKLTFVGVDFRLGTTGARVHRLSLGGLAAQEIANSNAAAYAFLASHLALDLTVIALGITDASTAYARTADQYEADVRTIIANVRAGRPNCVILLCAVNDTSDASQVARLNGYWPRLQKITVDTANVAYTDWRIWLGTYANASVQGWMYDASYPNGPGSDLIAQRVYELLGGSALRRPTVATAIG